ncbi:MAG: nuclear transport factor 2 family protein [Acidobacteriota bacterium]|nr:nuclear transport factor 2 family protein [Acidobacteriota bacterium]
MFRALVLPFAAAGVLAVASVAALPAQTAAAPAAQASPYTSPLDPLSRPPTLVSPLTQPTVSPGVLQLLELDARFSQAVVAGGGKAFAAWFAEEGMTLNNGKAAAIGRTAVRTQATWDPAQYQLSWTAEGAQMGPSSDMGFTWGRYEGRSHDRNGEPVVVTGRYITVWKKQPDGTWKVALDASANLPEAAGECCTLPKP